IGKGRNVAKPGVHLLAAAAEHAGIEINVVATGKFGIEARAELEECRDTPGRRDRSAVRMQGAAQNLQQRRLSGAVAANDGDGFASPNLEGHVPQRPELAVIPLRRLSYQPLKPRHNGLLEPVLRSVIDQVALGQVVNPDRWYAADMLRRCTGRLMLSA